VCSRLHRARPLVQAARAREREATPRDGTYQIFRVQGMQGRGNVAAQLTFRDGRTIDSTHGPAVVGIINATPDSFYPGSRSNGIAEAVAQGRAMADEGAVMLDVGGESTRPGSDPVSAAEEIRRTRDVVRALVDEVGMPVSIDTRKAAVAEQALEAGAVMVNDVSALRDDPEMAAVCVEHGAAVVLMHMQGTPRDMQRNPAYRDAPAEILEWLRARVTSAREAGVRPERIVIDPGIGFGKRKRHNLELLRHLRRFETLGYPVLVGLSRKSFIGMVLSPRQGSEERESSPLEDPPPENRLDVDQRLIGSVVANAVALLGGADLLRVHDVRETVQMIRMMEAIYGSSQAPEVPPSVRGAKGGAAEDGKGEEEAG